MNFYILIYIDPLVPGRFYGSAAAAAVGVLVRLDGEPEDTSDVSEVFTAASGELQLPSEAEGVNETEVESELEALKLTQENHSDIDSDFEDFDSEEESDSELVW